MLIANPVHPFWADDSPAIAALEEAARTGWAQPSRGVSPRLLTVGLEGAGHHLLESLDRTLCGFSKTPVHHGSPGSNRGIPVRGVETGRGLLLSGTQDDPRRRASEGGCRACTGPAHHHNPHGTHDD